MIKKITVRWLKKHDAWSSLKKMKQAEQIGDPIKVIKELMKFDRFSDANWLITRLLKRQNCQRYAIYAAKLVLPIFEETYPDDNRPREAIKAAERYLKNPTKKNKAEALSAAAASSSYASCAASYASSYTASYASSCASCAAIDAVKANNSIKPKIINYGIKLIREELKCSL